MKIRLFLLLYMITVSIKNYAHVATFDPAYVAVFFANPYPVSPSKSLRGIVMELWGESFEGIHAEHFVWSRDKQLAFANKLLDMNTLVDLLALQKNQYKEDIDSLLILLVSLEAHVYRSAASAHTDEMGCIKMVLDRIKKKMEQIQLSAPS